jgi:hypothetical protein
MATVGSDTSTLSVAELEAAILSTSSERLAKGRDQVAYVGNVATPTLNQMTKHGGVDAVPVRGGYRVHLAGPSNQEAQPVSGRDIHQFVSVDTLMEINYKVGAFHMGIEIPLQELELAGIYVDMKKAYKGELDPSKRGFWRQTGKSAELFERIVNLMEVKLRVFEEDFRTQLNKKMWLANASQAKLWQGLSGIIDPTVTTSGKIGDANRAASVYLRHHLETAVAVANLETKISQLRRKCNKRCRDGSRVDTIVCGENVYDIIFQKLVTGTSSLTKVFDRTMAADKAQAIAGKLAIGYPDDAIYVEGVGTIMIEPVFEDLEDETAATWDDYLFMYNSKHLAFKLTLGRDGNTTTVHPVPHNQRVLRLGKYVEAAAVASRADVHAALVISGS